MRGNNPFPGWKNSGPDYGGEDSAGCGNIAMYPCTRNRGEGERGNHKISC